MTIRIAALMLSASTLLACGSNNDEPPAETTALLDPVPQAESALAIPEAPPNPMIAANAERSAAYLEETRGRDGIVALDSGLLVETLVAPAEGSASPSPSDLVIFHMKGETVDGSVLVDSKEQGTAFQIPSLYQPQVTSWTELPFPGFQEAFPRMAEGETIRMVVPSELAYGVEGVPGAIGPNEALIFEIELVEVVTDEEADRRAEIIATEQASIDNTIAELAAENLAASQSFLAESTARESVRPLEGGLYIETLRPGTGETPASDDGVVFNLRISRIDGSVIADSEMFGRPLENTMSSPEEAFEFPGIKTAITAMREGEAAQVIVTPEAAFGEEGFGNEIGPNETLIATIALLDVITSDERNAVAIQAQTALSASADFLAEVAGRDGIAATQSGLLYEVTADGGDGQTPDPWDLVKVHYRGTLADGTEFDSSYARGEPATFQLNRVIPGWTEGLALMNTGDSYRFYIPPQLAYGEAGAGSDIGPNEALIFDVELLEIIDGQPPEGASRP